MSYRIHTATAAGVAVQVDTIERIDAELGYEFTEGEESVRRLLLNDLGNCEAWVFTGDRDDLRLLAERLLAAVNNDDNWR